MEYIPALLRHAFITALVLCQLPAQSNTAQFIGRVIDPAGAGISGARVKVVSASGISSTSTANEKGEFSLPLAYGTYTMSIDSDGFKHWSDSVVFNENSGGTRDCVLEITQHRDTITITESGYQVESTGSATRTPTKPLDLPQSITFVTKEAIRDQMMMSMGDAVRFVPGIAVHQGENNRDQVVIRGNNSSADFFVNGVRDDVQYYRDLYNLERVEALKGSNAMAFGRGGGGGVINRVTKEAVFAPFGEIAVQGGQFGDKRLALDVNRPLSNKLAFRLNGMYENADSFRRGVNLERYAFNPVVTIAAGQDTKFTLGFEHLHDGRVADRGLPSYKGLPADLAVETVIGDVNQAPVRADVNLGSATVERKLGGFNLRNRFTIGDYDRGYQNFVPGAVNADKTLIGLSAYNNATARRNLFNQTDTTYLASTGSIHHVLLLGAEFGRQLTDNFRSTGYFNNSATSLNLPYANPILSTPVTFRQSATDADNHLETNVGSAYVQDQVELTRFVRVIGGARFDHFDLQYRNNRNGDKLRRIDNLISPRAGVILKPIAAVSIYANYSVSFLPSSGDQFSSLTTITQQVKPEKFSNYEFGVKWDVDRRFSLTTAAYRLDRTNTRATDPNDPTRILQTGAQRTNGFELGWNGMVTRAWTVTGGVAYQDAFFLRATTAAVIGAHVAQVPYHTFSLWNKYQILPRLSVGLGILNRTDMFAAVDNTVTLPGYVRADGAVYFSVTEKMRLQVNAENLFDRRYVINADGNNNISPGSPRAVRAGLVYRF